MLLVGADTSSRQLINQAQAFPSSAKWPWAQRYGSKNSGKEVRAGTSPCTLFVPSRPAQPSLAYTFPFDNGILLPLFNLRVIRKYPVSKEQFITQNYLESCSQVFSTCQALVASQELSLNWAEYRNPAINSHINLKTTLGIKVTHQIINSN